MNNQDLESFALLYHGVECIKMKDNAYKGLLKPVDAINESKLLNKSFEKSIKYIELRSIESLTDKEANELGSINAEFFIKTNRLGGLKSYKINKLSPRKIDNLREMGIAVNFRNLSIEEIIEKGILKLKS